MNDHLRPPTYLAVVQFLQDGKWHSNEELAEVSQYPQDWLRELELAGHELERKGQPPGLVRLVA